MITLNNAKDKAALDRFSPAMREALEALVSGPMAREAEDALEARNLAERRELVDEITAIDANPDSSHVELGKRAAAALARVNELAEQLAKAKHEHGLLSQQSASSKSQRRRFQLEQQLMESADLRLDEYRAHLANIAGNDLQFAMRAWVATERDYFRGTKTTVPQSNQADVIAAIAAVKDGLQQVDALKLQALSRAEVAEALTVINRMLEKPLAKVETNPPLLCGHDCRPSAALKWGGRAQWVADEFHKPAPEVVAEKREDLRNRARANGIEA